MCLVLGTTGLRFCVAVSAYRRHLGGVSENGGAECVVVEARREGPKSGTLGACTKKGAVMPVEEIERDAAQYSADQRYLVDEPGSRQTK